MICEILEKQIGIDSIKWLTAYKETNKNEYQITAKPNSPNIKYEYKGTLLKTKNKVPKEYADKLNKLNEK